MGGEGKASSTGGVKAFSLHGRLYRERERLTTMTDEERCFRAKFLKDQKLSPCEPIPNPQLYRELNNPIYRTFKIPLNCVEYPLAKMIGASRANLVRHCIHGTLLGISTAYCAWYYFKYNAHDWTRKGGWRVITNRPVLLSNEEGYPSKYNVRHEPSDYASAGFNKHNPLL